MKLTTLFMFFLFSLNTVAVDKYIANLNKAKTNVEMKKAARDLLTAYEKEILNMENEISGSFKGAAKSNFDKAKRDWRNFYLSESRFLGFEFSQGTKYVTSGSLKAKDLKIGLLEKRYKYLKRLQKARGL